jgi:hypothetical protein
MGTPVPSGLPREAALVFRCADFAADPAEVRALVRVGMDWPRLLRLAEAAVATPSLWRVVAGAPEGVVPPEVQEVLRRSAAVHEFRMRFLSGRLTATIGALRARGIEVALLKGAAVGALVDPTFVARPMTDLDLLVRRADAAAAQAAARTVGWQEMGDAVLDELLRDHHHLPPLVDPRLPGMRLELHTALFPPDHSFAFTEDDLWQAAAAADGPFAGARVPSVEHLLLHGCLHFAWQHTMQFGAWRTFRLVSALVGTGALDWERFTALARSARGATACHWTLRLARRMSGIAIPEGVLERLAPPGAEWVHRRLEQHFIAGILPGELPPNPSDRMTHLLWRVALRPRWSGHREAGRWTPGHHWDQVRSGRGEEGSAARMRRHLGQTRAWWDYLRRTILG